MWYIDRGQVMGNTGLYYLKTKTSLMKHIKKVINELKANS
jgi:hypothetical protein